MNHSAQYQGSPQGHALLAPSRASRWMNCPLCLAYLENTGGKAALEGTWAHEIAAAKLTGARDLRFAPQDMKDAVAVYVNYINSRRLAGGMLTVETPVRISRVHEDCWGTCDAFLQFFAPNRLEIVDFKSGIVVKCRPDSPQLKLYAVGVIDKLNQPDNSPVDLTIVQPRNGGITTSMTTAGELRQWADDVMNPAARRCFEDPTAAAAGSWCRFCTGRVECAEFERNRNVIWS